MLIALASVSHCLVFLDIIPPAKDLVIDHLSPFSFAVSFRLASTHDEYAALNCTKSASNTNLHLSRRIFR